ncbi:MAG: DUF177 domain-containing protein [Planctomycetes bacterium]|nr:DUF177 domain-containing protein [Planctomycetota bacterium]
MKINVHAVTEEGLTLSDKATAEMLGIATTDLPLTADVDVSLTAFKVQQAIHVSGTARTTIRIECARCLKEVPHALSSRFQMVFKESVAGDGRAEQQVGEGDVGITYFTGHEIEVGPEIRQSLLLAMPMRLLCKADCKGLCPQCGRDLNSGPCRCVADSRKEQPATMADLMKKWGGRH